MQDEGIGVQPARRERPLASVRHHLDALQQVRAKLGSEDLACRPHQSLSEHRLSDDKVTGLRMHKPKGHEYINDGPYNRDRHGCPCSEIGKRPGPGKLVEKARLVGTCERCEGPDPES